MITGENEMTRQEKGWGQTSSLTGTDFVTDGDRPPHLRTMSSTRATAVGPVNDLDPWTIQEYAETPEREGHCAPGSTGTGPGNLSLRSGRTEWA